MTKAEFILSIKEPLKKMGYRKSKNYWYKMKNDILLCIDVEGSQWNKDNYYVSIGVTTEVDTNATPSILKWNFSHRCTDKQNKELNILPSVLFQSIEEIFSELSFACEIPSFLIKRKAVKVGNQYCF